MNATIGLLAYGLRPSPLAEVPVYLLASGAYTSMSWDLQMAAAHADCHVSAFCRNPLHPGPCKGWKHHLGLVSPGALHALEKVRHEKLEEKRKARVEALTKAGHPVPKSLLKPIVYDPAKSKFVGPNAGPAVTPGSPNLTPAAAKKAVAAIPTAADLRSKVNARRAALPSTPAAPVQHTPESLAAAYSVGLLMHLGVPQQQAEANRASLEAQFARAIASKDPRDLEAMASQFTTKLIDKAEKDSGKKLYSGHSSVSQAMNAELVAKFKGDHTTPSPVTDAILNGDPDTAHNEALKIKGAALKAKASASAAKAAATRAANKRAAAVPAPNLPQGTPSHIQNAVAIAHRTGPRAGIAKVQTDAYNNLTKAEFDALPDATKQRITDDLKAAHAKFQDPAKKRSVEHTMGRLGIGPHPAPSNAPGGPSPIGAPHGLGAPSVAPAPRHAAPAGTTFTPGSIGTISHLGKRHDQRLADYEKLDHAQLAGLSDAQRAALHGDLMNIAAKAPSAADRKHAADLIDRLNAANPSSVAKSAAAVQAANAHGFTKTLDDIRNETDPRKIASALTAARYAATDKDHKKALDDLAGEVAGNSSHPAWLRAHAYMINDDNRNALPQSAELSMAIHTASKAPSSNGRIFATTHDLEQLLAPDKKELDRLPPVLRDAVQTRRTEALKDTFDPAHGATLQARESALVAVFGDPQGKPNFDRYDALTPEGRKVVNTGLEQHIVNKTSGVAGLDAARGSAWQSVKDTLDSKTYSPHQEAAIKAAQDSSGSALSRLSQFDRLDHASFQALPDAHKTAISLPLLSWGGGNPSPAVRQESLHLLAKFSGAYPDYSTQRHQDAVLAATIDRGFLDARQRSARYHALSGSDWHLLKPADRGLIAKDMQGLADDRSGQLGLGDRHDIQFHHDVLTGNISNYSSEQKAAYAAADPGSNVDITDRLAAYGKLDSSSFGALPAAYQDAIKSDLSIISLTHPSEHDAVMAKLDPSFVPANNLKPTSVIGSNVDPQLKAAVETLYGLHPKAHTAAHQLSTYGALKTHQFHQLNSDEQSQLLGDLSYIATTSKGTNKDKAERLINNFTPPGTPYGQPNVQAVIPPSNAVAGQVRDPNPKGTTGLLVQARDKGLSGDGWTTTPGGKRVWGKYGASGVLLRHVGPDGKERFLMVQRGPAISDPGKWQFPGGAIDSKETAYTGGTREVIEELGFKDGSLDDAAVHGHHESGIPGSTWKYTSIAATVPKQLVPDLSDPHARAETSDAKWMTREEIAQLDTGGKLLAPLAGGKLEQNVLSLFPPGAHTVGRPAPRTTRLDRLRGTPSIAVAPPKPHKTSRAKNLITDLQAEKGLSQQLKTMRKQYAGKTADDRLAAIGELQGFNDTPTVTSKAEVDRLLATGNYVEAWRGVYGSSNGTKTAADINEEMRSGPAYYGTGIFGNGYYLATDKSVARQYSDGSKNSIVRVLIPKDASTIDHAKALDGARQSYSSVPYRYNARSTTGQGSLHDEGRWAAAKGHDGIVISQHSRAPGGGATHVARAGKPAYNWLNRSVLIIQEADK